MKNMCADFKYYIEFELHIHIICGITYLKDTKQYFCMQIKQ